MRYLDVETDMSAPPDRNLVCVVIDGVLYERRKMGDDAMKALFESLKDDTICGHFIKFDIKTIYRNFGVLLEHAWCTGIAAKILRNGMREKSGAPIDNSLVPVLEYFLGVKEKVHAHKKEIRTKYSLKRDLTATEIEYIHADAAHLPALQKRLEQLIKDDKLEFVFKEEMALMPVLIKKEVKGVRIDTEKLHWLTQVWKRGKRIAVRMLDREITNLMNRSGRPMLFVTYGYGSTKQVSQIFKDLRLPTPVKKERLANGHVLEKESNDEDALTEYLYEYPESPLKRFIEIYLWYKEIDKLISTYGEKMLNQVDADGYIRMEFNQLGAETGRLSSSAPNCQNLPAKGHGAKVRNCFLPDPGEVFVDTDMDGAEIRIAADASGDPLLVAAINDGVDMHSKLASATFSVMVGESVSISKSKTPIMVKGHKLIPNQVRDEHKAVTFSFFYLGGPNRIYTIVGDYIRKYRKDVKVACKEMYEELGRQLPVLSTFLKAKVEEATSRGYLRLPKSGRIRYFDKSAYGNAANNDIQGINAEAIKVAMINMDRWLTETGYGRLVLNVHDQLITSCNPAYVDLVKEKQTQVMADSLSYFLTNIKGASSCKVTQYWEK